MKPPDHSPIHLASDECDGTITLDFSQIDDKQSRRIEADAWENFTELDSGVAVEVEGLLRWNRRKPFKPSLLIKRVIESK